MHVKQALGGSTYKYSPQQQDFVVPLDRMTIKQHRAFSIVGPSTWSSLPSELRSLPRDLSRSFYKLFYFRPGLGSYLEVAL